MANSSTDDLFNRMDYNRDGKITRDEMRRWMDDRVNATPYDSHYGGRHFSPCEFDHVGYSRPWQGEQVVHTSGPDETNNYLQHSDHNLCLSPQKVVEDSACSSPILREQQVSVRFLRPPTPPPPGPLIIKQVREKQPPVPPPLVIDERPPRAVTPPVLVLRERPPTPPPCVPCETKVECIPAGPAPKRSVIIHRYEAVPQKPRDIIIERWLPYGPRPERRVIIQPACEAVNYPEATFTIYKHGAKYEGVKRKFQNLGVVREDPYCYLSRYSGQLLDSTSLLREARSHGVNENIDPPAVVAYGESHHGYSSYGDYGYYEGGSVTKTYASSPIHGGCNYGSYRVTFRDPLSYRYAET